MNNQELIQLVDELRALPKENEWVEFKTGTATTNEKFGQYVSAISNAACIANQSFGYLVFGIDDTSHEVTGTAFKFKNKKEGNEELELWLRRLLDPSLRFQHFTCKYGQLYLEVFKIPAAIVEPTHFKRIPYIRFNSSLTDLRNFPQHIKAIYNSQEDWSAQIIDKATLNDLDEYAVVKAKEKFKEKKAGSHLYTEIDKWDDITFLDKAKITINGKMTNTAIILLGKAESAHLISPAVAQITWKLDTEEKAYEHFEMPLFLSVNAILARIRNVKYKFFPDNQMLSTEVNKYETKVILEALNNCIAHQDYGHHSRIILTEQINKLIFSNAGGFFEGNAEDYTSGDKTPKKYRNRWLAEAMVNLNMIDTMGYGIYRMYIEQRKRFFPLPDYTKSTSDHVVLEIYGHTIDENYSKLLIEKKDDLNLTEVILLDKVQKSLPIMDDAVKLLKKKGLIEGRKGLYHISSAVASATGMESEYIKVKGIEDDYCKKLIKNYIEKFKAGKRADFENLLDDKLAGLLTPKQKKDKVKNLLQAMKRDEIIYLQGNEWRLKQ
ncbi:MAG: RNA-binding domain-containing protein [Bacteroidota bacterium]